MLLPPIPEFYVVLQIHKQTTVVTTTVTDHDDYYK